MTLIEAMMLIGLVTVGMAAAFYLMAIGAQMNMNTHDTEIAYQAANEYVEYLRQQPFASLANTTNTAFGATAGSIGYDAISDLSNGQGLYTIANDPGGTTLKKITVTVNWSSRSATANRTVAVTTLMGSRGLNETWK